MSKQILVDTKAELSLHKLHTADDKMIYIEIDKMVYI